MQIASPESKVGLFTISALIALIAIFLWLNGVQILQPGQQLEAIFDRIEGLRPGAPVKYIGVDVGRVTKIYFEDQKVVVGFRITSDLKLPETVEAQIASAGVVGDKYLELVFKPEAVREGDRIYGKSPASMEDFYASATEIMNSLKKITNSLSEMLGDKELASYLKDTIVRVDHLATTLDRIAVNGEPQIYAILENMNKTSSRLAEAGLTTTRLLSQIDNNGQTAADLRETLEHIKKISENLDRFSKILADNDSNIGTLIDDAHRTMQSIDQAAKTIDQAVKSFTQDGGELGNLRQTLDRAGTAVQKVDAYVKKLEQLSISQGIGAGYREPDGFTVDYGITARFNEQSTLEFRYEGIGEENLASLQLSTALKNPAYRGRAGLYKNEFGVGLDYTVKPNLTLGLSAWDTESPKLGLTSQWRLTDDWSLKLSTSSDVETHAHSWDITGWFKF
jgi:phospholipid/cholesterol/gamma-HCH transport system substrate-binding protein